MYARIYWPFSFVRKIIWPINNSLGYSIRSVLMSMRVYVFMNRNIFFAVYRPLHSACGYNDVLTMWKLYHFHNFIIVLSDIVVENWSTLNFVNDLRSIKSNKSSNVFNKRSIRFDSLNTTHRNEIGGKNSIWTQQTFDQIGMICE